MSVCGNVQAGEVVELRRGKAHNQSNVTLSSAIETQSLFRKIYGNPWKETWKEKSMMDMYDWIRGNKHPEADGEHGSSGSAMTSPSSSNAGNHSNDSTDSPQKVQVPQFQEHAESNSVSMTWLGHASVLIEVDGWRILTDPVFSGRCSPFTNHFGPKRLSELPCEIEHLPLVDAVVISHNHYDHLDVTSVKAIRDSQARKRQQSPQKSMQPLLWCVPMGLKKWMQDTLSHGAHVEECLWWEELHLDGSPSLNKEGLKICFVPAQHWSWRGIGYRNTSLWGGWVVVGAQHKAYFVGDTGYCAAFKEIGSVYAPIHMSAIPIGAYKPRWFMKAQHVDPKEAVRIHREVQSQLSLGIHWGTFKLTDEPLEEPPRKLETELRNAGLDPNVFRTVDQGATLKYLPQ